LSIEKPTESENAAGLLVIITCIDLVLAEILVIPLFINSITSLRTLIFAISSKPSNTNRIGLNLHIAIKSVEVNSSKVISRK
jgi:hypothetical protein